MEEIRNCGISTKDLRQLRQSTITSLGTSKVQEEPIICKFGVQTQAGSKSLYTLMSTFVISKTRNV